MQSSIQVTEDQNLIAKESLLSIYLSVTLLLVLIVLLPYSKYLELIQAKQFIIPNFDKQGGPYTYTSYVGRDASKPACI